MVLLTPERAREVPTIVRSGAASCQTRRWSGGSFDRRAPTLRPMASSAHPAAATGGGGIPEDGFRPDIEGLRGVAVALVVLYHGALLGFVGGFVGVDVFFVISGFLITGLLLRELERRGRISFRAFYARRVRRLAPAGAVVLLVTLVATFLLVDPLDRPDLLADGAAAALSFGNMRFAAQASDYFATVSTPSPFLHFWSLAVEEQFYLVWPALLAGVALLARGRRVRLAVGVAMALVIVASFAINLVITNVSVDWAFYSLPTRAWQLAAGGLVAVLGQPLRRVPAAVQAGLGTAGLLAIVVSALVIDGSVPYPGVAAAVPTLGAVALLVAAGRGPARLLTLAPVRFLGQISYSLYLWHWPLLVLPAAALGAALAPNQVVGLMCLAVVVAWLSWRYVETPFRAGFGGRLSRWPGRVVAVGVTGLLALALLAGGLSWQQTQALAAAAGTPEPTVLSGGPCSPARPRRRARRRRRPARLAVPSAGPSPSGPVSYALPADVHPTPAGARADQTETQLRADGCMGLDATSVPPTCFYGDPNGTFTLALVGDSHAAQWFLALDAIAKARHWRLETFAKVRCPFLDIRMINIAGEARVHRVRGLGPRRGGAPAGPPGRPDPHLHGPQLDRPRRRGR